MADLLVLRRPAKSLQNGAGLSGKMEHTGLVENKRLALVPQREQLANTPESLFHKEKEQSRLPKAPNREVGENQSE